MTKLTATRKAEALRRKLIKFWPLEDSRAINGIEVTASDDGTYISVTALSYGAVIRTNTLSAELGAWDLYRHAKGIILHALEDAIQEHMHLNEGK